MPRNKGSTQAFPMTMHSRMGDDWNHKDLGKNRAGQAIIAA